MNRLGMSDEDSKLHRELYSKCDCGDPQECSTCYWYEQDEKYLEEKYFKSKK